MGLMKKLHLRGWKPPRIRTVCPSLAERRVRQKPVQLDMFEGNWFYHEKRLLYVVSSQENDSPS